MKCLTCNTKMKCYDDVTTNFTRIDWVQCPECESRAELLYDNGTKQIKKVTWTPGNRELYVLKKGLSMYRTWFIQSSIMLVVSLITFIYFRFFYDGITWILPPSFMMIIVTCGWTCSAFAGMYSNYKKIKDESNKK